MEDGGVQAKRKVDAIGVSGEDARDCVTPEFSMSDLVPLMPRMPVPPLQVALAGGGRYDLGSEKPKLFSMIVFYRGLHCQQCQAYIGELERLLPEFESRGIASVAISCDTAERGERTKADWDLAKTRIGYGLSLRMARDWGLFLTQGRARAQGLSEPPYCCEPALFLVAPDKTLWFSSVQNMAFGRPRFADILDGFEFLFARGYFTEKECPARGEVMSVPDELFMAPPERGAS
jgi:alkyl hydroperoxide reductase subunit AhpC